MSNDSPNIAPIPRIAAPIGELVDSIGLPKSTHAELEARGLGCPTFRLGRRKYALIETWEAWLQERAKE